MIGLERQKIKITKNTIYYKPKQNPILKIKFIVALKLKFNFNEGLILKCNIKI